MDRVRKMNKSDLNSCVEKYYNEYDEDGRLLRKFNSVEYITTMKYIEKYLRPGMKIAEIGAGTGRYSAALAEKGFSVDAVELVWHNIDVFKSKIKPGYNVRIFQGNAVDLPFQNDIFDITLLLGPMYHLFSKKEQVKALSEALRVTKPGGIVFAAYVMNDLTVYDYLFRRGRIHEYKSNGWVDADFHAQPVPELIFYLYRKEDIDSLMSGLNAERLHFVGTDMLSPLLRDSIGSMDEDTFGEYLDFHFKICERADVVGLSSHSLDIFRKIK